MTSEVPEKSYVAPLVLSLQGLLFSEPGMRTFAVLDGASIADLLPKLDEYRPEHTCLYRGEISPDLAECAPYLVLLEPDAPFTHWLLLEGWGKHWGIFAFSAATFNAVRLHFRKFLVVKDPQGKRLYFRYYDPRVLRVYLPTCEPSETEILFGQVSRYLCEADRPGVALTFDLEAGLPKRVSNKLS